MPKAPKLITEQELDAALGLLQHLLAVQLYKSGVT